jgi:hypothetical protein
MKPFLLFVSPLIVLLIITLTNVKASTAAPFIVEINYLQHRFSPQKIDIPAGVPITLKVVNASKERIEFESFRLHREKVVGPGQTLVLHLPALTVGSYDFYDDFHDDVPEGSILAH